LQKWSNNNKPKTADPKFRKFQQSFCLVLSIVYLGDWLQGAYQYNLYKSFGYSIDQIALFFTVGYATCAIFGLFVGVWCDVFGQRLGCLSCCMIYATSMALKCFSNIYVVIFARFLGGISTSLLFSVFESWMCKHHTELGCNLTKARIF
jgi:MFS family permease